MVIANILPKSLHVVMIVGPESGCQAFFEISQDVRCLGLCANAAATTSCGKWKGCTWLTIELLCLGVSTQTEKSAGAPPNGIVKCGRGTGRGFSMRGASNGLRPKADHNHQTAFKLASKLDRCLRARLT